jgi:hypothetical protein
MARARWSRSDIPGTVQLGAIFVAVGAVFGLLSGGGIIIGALAGALIFGMVIGVGTIVEAVQRKQK